MLRVAICALHGRMLRAALYMAAWCTPCAGVRPMYDETAPEAHRCRATTAQPRREILIIQSGAVSAKRSEYPPTDGRGGNGRGVRRSSSFILARTLVGLGVTGRVAPPPAIAADRRCRRSTGWPAAANRSGRAPRRSCRVLCHTTTLAAAIPPPPGAHTHTPQHPVVATPEES